MAESAGGRLPTFYELFSFINGHAIFSGDYWAPTKEPNGDKDWIQIGDNPHYPGKSHTVSGAYPSWGNDNSRAYTYKSVCYLKNSQDASKGYDGDKTVTSGCIITSVGDNEYWEADIEGGPKEVSHVVITTCNEAADWA